MTEQEQRVAIAEACGWQFFQVADDGKMEGLPPNKKRRDYLPNYLHDLNAMQEALRHLKANVMNSDQWEDLGKWVEKAHPSACLRAPGTSSYAIDYFDFATLLAETTAATLAEGVLRVLDKWGNP